MLPELGSGAERHYVGTEQEKANWNFVLPVDFLVESYEEGDEGRGDTKEVVNGYYGDRRSSKLARWVSSVGEHENLRKPKHRVKYC